MSFILHPPKNWDEFQNVCHDLWRLLWNDPNTQINGRQGHTQNGVDIFGLPYYASTYHGVQCKGRNKNYESILTTNEVDAECKEADGKFKPGLESLVVATTSPRDPKVQEHCRMLTQSHTYRFKVSVWSWDDIEEEIQYRPELMQRYYPNVQQKDLPDSIVIDYIFVDDKIHAFFSRPKMLNAISYDYRHYLYAIVTELADNAFSKGKAERVTIEFKDSTLVIKDNGVPFNPGNLLETGGQGGAYTLKKLIELFNGQVKLTYQYSDQNEFSISLPKGVLNTLMNEDYSITVNDNRFFGRPFAHQMASQQFSNVPIEKKRIKVIVDTPFGLAMSNAAQYFTTALSLIGSDQHIEVFYTQNSGDASFLNDLFAGKPIEFKNL